MLRRMDAWDFEDKRCGGRFGSETPRRERRCGLRRGSRVQTKQQTRQ